MLTSSTKRAPSRDGQASRQSVRRWPTAAGTGVPAPVPSSESSSLPRDASSWGASRSEQASMVSLQVAMLRLLNRIAWVLATRATIAWAGAVLIAILVRSGAVTWVWLDG